MNLIHVWHRTEPVNKNLSKVLFEEIKPGKLKHGELKQLVSSKKLNIKP